MTEYDIDSQLMIVNVVFDDQVISIRQIVSELEQSGYTVQNLTEIGGSKDLLIADAGRDQAVYEGDQVMLDGSNSVSENGEIILYLWEQTAGPLVLSGPHSDLSFSFAAPEVAAETVLKFMLTIENSAGLSAADEIEITVKKRNATDDPQESGSGSGDGGCFIQSLQ